MPGFLISDRPGTPIGDNFRQEDCIREELPNGRYQISRNTLKRYLKDKVMFENESHIFLTEGVFLNKTELMERFGQKTMETLLQAMLKADPKGFFSAFRGSFSGAVYFKAEDRWLFYTDHLGSRPLFYHKGEGGFLIGSELHYVSHAMSALGIKREPEIEFFKYMAVYGFELDERVCLKEVFRLEPGSYLEYAGGKLTKGRYFKVSDKPDKEITPAEAIERMDDLFRRAVRLIFEKDREYGYKTMLDLSGGMDSRATAYVARDLGYEPGLCTSFSQTGSREQQIFQEVARDLGFNYLFYALDNIEHLRDVDEIIRMNSGTCYYCGIGAMKRLLETLNTGEIGMSITGIFGDVYKGGHLFRTTAAGYKKPDINNLRQCKAYSYRVKTRLDNRCTEGYETVEEFLYSVRDMYGNMNTGLTKQNYLETVTPFGDPDFLSFFYSLPRQMRIDGKITLLWLRDKYRDALKIRYADTGRRPLESNFMKFMAELPLRVVRKLAGILKIPMESSKSMNPFGYWYKTDARFRGFISDYDRRYRPLLQNEPEILEMVRVLIEEGEAYEKLIGLSMISAYKTYIA